MGLHGPTRFTTTRTWGKATTFPFVVFSLIHHGGYTQMAFFLGLQVGSPKNFKIGTPAILDAHNFLLKASIEARCKKKL
jgi:hypothetical protein